MQRLFILLLTYFIASAAMAASYTLSDGRTITGEPVGFSDRGLVLKQADGSYSDAYAWGQLSQETLKTLRDHPKAGRFAEPFITLTDEEREKLSGLTLAEVPRLDRPAGRTGLIGMLFSSGVGWFLILLIYVGNIFAAYEIALYRAYSPQVVCGVAAVLPWIGPVTLLAVPREIMVGVAGGRKISDTMSPPPPGEDEVAEIEADPAPEAILPPGEAFEETPLSAEAGTPLLPETVTFSRGVVTFNRRFFETKLPKFTKAQKPEDIADMVLVFKTSRGDYLTRFISKLEQTSLNVQVAKGPATEEVKVPYLEIYEVQLKHKDLI